jgi:DNA repair protein RadC
MNEVRVMLVREPSAKNGRPISSAEEVFRRFKKELGNLDREVFMVIMLDIRNNPIGKHTVSVGTLNQTIVHPREVFKAAILTNAFRVLLVHNHPSGEPDPSAEDRKLTKVLVDAGKLLDIEVMDHVIVGSERFFSFKGAGILG